MIFLYKIGQHAAVKKLQTQAVSSEKMRKLNSFVTKAVCKMLLTHTYTLKTWSKFH